MAVDLPSEQTAPGFDDPLGMLTACHRRIERNLATLARLQRHLPENGCDGEARAAARGILKYFDSAAANHHADEEQSLFPRLLRIMPVEVQALIDALERDHAALADDWLRLRPLLAAIAVGHRDNLSPKAVGDLTAAYRSHIEREESELIPLAMEACDATMIADIGREMAERRGIDPAQLPNAMPRRQGSSL